MWERIKIPVEEFTSPSPASVSPDATLSRVVGLMDDLGIRHIPVIEHDMAIGIISDRDLTLLSRYAHFDRVRIGDVMTLNPYQVEKDTPLDEVALELSRRKIGSAVITEDDGTIYGIFTVTDALNALIEVLRGDLDISDFYPLDMQAEA